MRLKDIPTATRDEILQNLLDTLTSLKNGHLTARMTEGFPGIYNDIAQTLNAHLETLCALTAEHHRLMEEVGTTGRLGGQMHVEQPLSGAWQSLLTDSNRMSANLTNQFRDASNCVRDALHDPASTPTLTAANIQGEFAAFRL